MSIQTITQPPFIIDTEIEKDTSWPDNSVVYVKATNMTYYLKSGVFYNLVDTMTNGIPRLWLNAIREATVKEYLATGTVAGGAGIVSFSLVDASAAAVFTNVYKESSNFWIDSQISYNFSSWTLSVDKKTLTVKVSNPIIAALVIVYANAPNGTTVYLQVRGD